MNGCKGSFKVRKSAEAGQALLRRHSTVTANRLAFKELSTVPICSTSTSFPTSDKTEFVIATWLKNTIELSKPHPLAAFMRGRNETLKSESTLHGTYTEENIFSEKKKAERIAIEMKCSQSGGLLRNSDLPETYVPREDHPSLRLRN